MPEIDVSGGFECGGFHWPVSIDGRECLKNDHFGECNCNEHKITIDPNYSPERVSETIIHEIMEAVKHIYLDSQLKHRDLTLLANGLHQVMRSLGVQFTVTKPELKKFTELPCASTAEKGNGHG